jgi:glycerol kinase
VGEAPIYASVGENDSGSSVLTWLRQKFHLPWRDEQLSAVAEAAPGGDGLVFVPALKGLDAPYACPPARGVIYGLDPNTGLEHVLRAALQAVAFTAADLIRCLGREIEPDEGTPLRADGGMTANAYLMQFQADILGRPLLVSSDPEATAHGAANLVRVALGAAPGLEELRETQPSGRIYTPHMPAEERESRIACWRRAVAQVIEAYQLSRQPDDPAL